MLGQKMAQFFYTPITSSNINRFLKFVHCRNQQKICTNAITKDPPHLICVAALQREMSDIALKPATTLTNCVINVDRAWHVAPKQPGLKSGRLCCLGAFNRWHINTDNPQQSTSWNRRSSLSGANCRSVWLVSGVAVLSASSSSKADTLNIMWKLRDMKVSLDNNWDKGQVVSCC